jgi:flagellar motility protein MotE (MotC chaperone)
MNNEEKLTKMVNDLKHRLLVLEKENTELKKELNKVQDGYDELVDIMNDGKLKDIIKHMKDNRILD